MLILAVLAAVISALNLRDHDSVASALADVVTLLLAELT